MASPTDLLIVGGHGVVGRRVAARLAPRFPGRVVIAGRNERQAQALCRELGYGTRARRLDVEDAGAIGSALDGIGTVMSCVSQRELHLLRTSIRRQPALPLLERGEGHLRMGHPPTARRTLRNHLRRRGEEELVSLHEALPVVMADASSSGVVREGASGLCDAQGRRKARSSIPATSSVDRGAARYPKAENRRSGFGSERRRSRISVRTLLEIQDGVFEWRGAIL